MQLHDIGVALDLLENVGIVHEDALLLNVGFVVLVEVGALDDLQRIQILLIFLSNVIRLRQNVRELRDDI